MARVRARKWSTIVCAQKRSVCGSNDFKRSRWNSVQNQLDTDLEKFGLHICSPWHRRRVSPPDFNQRSNPGIRIDVRPRNCALRDRRFDLRVVRFRFCIVRARHPGTDRSPKKLVTRGLYRYSRNPMYVGVLTVIFAWAVLYRGRGVAVYALVVAICFYSFVVFFEEPILRKRFGADYEHYCREVPRWLFR